ncbi:MAG: hypothetical protein II135_08055, partial [Clostridia bacterium]|nr:hypothetical protein [Clostridia bacterium]
ETSVLDAVCVSDGTAVLKYVGNILVLTYTDGVRTAMAFKAVDTSEYRDRYIYALYTDRSVYFANDTVNIWGNVRGLYGAGIPRELYVFTGFCAVGTPVAVDADGTFRTSAKIENAMRTQTFVRVEDAEGNVLAYTYITVTEEEKPVLKANMSLDKTHCFYGETVTATVKVTFFDGTPAEGYDVGVLCSKFPVYKTVTTDANGCAEFNINTGYIKAYGTQPICISANAYVSGEGTDRIECAGSFMYFHSDLVLKASGRTLTLNELDRSKCPEYAAGAPAEGKVKYRLIKVTYEKHTYKEYDNYLKRMMERTRYDRIESCESIGALQFENGRIELPEVKAKDENEYYYYKITFTDVHNTYEMSLPASGSSYGAYYYEPNAAYVTLDKESYLEGDKVKARFVPGINTNADAVTVFTGRSYISHASGTEAEFVFTEELLPEVLVSVLYFDLGKHVWRTERTSAKFDYASALDGNISVTADRSEYRPGDTAVITVTSPALAGGKAIVSIVDEACFALGENDFNVLDYLKSCGYIQKYVYGSAYRNMYFSNVNGLNTVFDNVALMWQFNDRGYSALNSGGMKFSLIDGIYYESNYLLD